MKHLAVCLACLVLFPLVWLDEKRQAKQRQVNDHLAKAVAGTIPPKRRIVDNVVFQTPFGSMHGFTVNASCDAERAEILYAKYLSMGAA